MTDREPVAPTDLSDGDIKEALVAAYEASDLIGEVMTADVPVMSPVTSRYRNMLNGARSRYSESLATLSTDPELLALSEAIHTDRCGCSPGEPKEGCDWYVAGEASSQRSRFLLQAGELRINGFTPEDVSRHNPSMDGFLDYLDMSKQERLALAESEQQSESE